MSRSEIERLNDGVCYFASPGRGDCEHAIGLPGESVPGQHDGPDDTVDVYGRPNGWCWHCWHMHRIAELEAIVARLPVNAEGKRVAPGDTRYFASGHVPGGRPVISSDTALMPDCSRTYATESAARAAAEKAKA